MQLIKITAVSILAGAVLIFSGCATVEQKDPDDPFEGSNRSFHNFNDALDRNIMVPVAEGYLAITPDPVRDSVTNFFDNVKYINVIVNDLLQGKVGDFMHDSGRFIVNSTVGIGGLFDPASEVGLAQHDEDLGQTLGVWGSDEQAYLVLPFFVPNSIRDAPDLVSSWLLNPLSYLTAAISWPLTAVDWINIRANLLDETEFVDQAALDPYTFIREAYLQRREFLIHDGNPPVDDFEDFFEDEDEGVLKIF